MCEHDERGGWQARRQVLPLADALQMLVHPTVCVAQWECVRLAMMPQGLCGQIM